MAERIVDRRTGKHCDYGALLEELEALIRKGLPFPTASRSISKLVSLDLIRQESVVHALRRQRDRSATRTQEAPPLVETPTLAPGLGVLYHLLAEAIATLRAQVTGSFKGKSFYDTAEKHAEELRAFIKRRLAALDAMQQEERQAALLSLSAGLESIGGIFAPDNLWEADLRELNILLDRARNILNEIDIRRPDR